MIFPKETFLYTDKSYSKGDVLMYLESVSCPSTDSSRIQVDDQSFILPPMLLAHSCEPNAYINWQTMKLKALRTMQKGTLVTYHYGTSEGDYRIGKFQCECGSPSCTGEFQGFMFLSDKEKIRIKDFVSPYIRKKYFDNR